MEATGADRQIGKVEAPTGTPAGLVTPGVTRAKREATGGDFADLKVFLGGMACVAGLGAAMVGLVGVDVSPEALWLALGILGYASS